MEKICGKTIDTETVKCDVEFEKIVANFKS